MGMVVTQLVFASTLSGDTETLHNRRKVMVRLAGAYCPMENDRCFIILTRQGLHAELYHSIPAAYQQFSALGCTCEVPKHVRQKPFSAFVRMDST